MWTGYNCQKVLALTSSDLSNFGLFETRADNSKWIACEQIESFDIYLKKKLAKRIMSSDQNEQVNVSTEAAIEAISLIEDHDDFVDPWNVESKSDTGVDYDKLISELRNKQWTHHRMM